MVAWWLDFWDCWLVWFRLWGWLLLGGVGYWCWGDMLVMLLGVCGYALFVYDLLLIRVLMIWILWEAWLLRVFDALGCLDYECWLVVGADMSITFVR